MLLYPTFLCALEGGPHLGLSHSSAVIVYLFSPNTLSIVVVVFSPSGS